MLARHNLSNKLANKFETIPPCPFTLRREVIPDILMQRALLLNSAAMAKAQLILC